MTKDIVGETLRRGDRGLAVAAMQKRLTAHGITTSQDGSFGPTTEANLKTFQTRAGLAVDGVCGKGSWTALLAVSTSESSAEVQKGLTSIGFRCDTPDRLRQAVKDFQGMWNLGPALAVDGVPGPLTREALQKSISLGGKVSLNFKASEFACKCGGKYSDCRRIWVSRRLLAGLEVYRKTSGSLRIISGCRCPKHNASQGGTVDSPHMRGFAADVPAVYSVQTVRNMGVFTNIGYNKVGGTVRHVDVRPERGTTSNPHTYSYA